MDGFFARMCPGLTCDASGTTVMAITAASQVL